MIGKTDRKGNNGTIEELLNKVKKILINEKII